MRNIDKIKSLEHELGRWQKKAQDQAAELERLRRGGEELRRAADALLTAAAVAYGAPVEEEGVPLGWRLTLPRFDIGETLERYALQARREGGVYVLGAALRK